MNELRFTDDLTGIAFTVQPADGLRYKWTIEERDEEIASGNNFGGGHLGDALVNLMNYFARYCAIVDPRNTDEEAELLFPEALRNLGEALDSEQVRQWADQISD